MDVAISYLVFLTVYHGMYCLAGGQWQGRVKPHTYLMSCYRPLRPALGSLNRAHPLKSLPCVLRRLTDDLKKEIRLLYLLPAEKLESTIHCRLDQIFLGDNPKYECLSYVWGEPDYTVAIELNGQQHFITPNLDMALRHIRLPTETRVLWVDAICINQADVMERGQQVALMREIYGNCQVDLAWLCTSEEPEHWTRITDGLKLMGEICTEEMRLGGEEWYSRNTGGVPYSRPYGMEHTGADFVDGPRREIIWGQDDSDIMPIRFGIDGIFLLQDTFQKPKFWNRIWIVQELARSPEVILIAPDVHLDWRAVSVYLGGGRYEEVLDRSRTAISGHEGSLIEDFGWIFEKAKTIEYQRSILRGIRDDARSSLMDSLIRFRCTSSTDPRDKIYALLGLLPEPCGVTANYHKDEKQLFAEVSLQLINTSATLDIICQNYWIGRRYESRYHEEFGRMVKRFAARTDSGPSHLPTWAADFSHRASSYDLHEHFLFAQRSTFSAGSPFCQVPCKVRHGTELQLRGVAIGSIAEVHDQKGQKGDYRGYDQLRTWMTAVFGESIQGAFTQRYEATGETCFRAFWRTAVMDCAAYPIRRLRDGELDLEETRYLANLRVRFDGPDGELDSDDTYQGDPVSQEVLMRNAENWEFCVMTTGFYVLSLSGITKPGDLVVILDGGKVPVLVRPVAKKSPPEQERYYQIVHVVYVHGFMSGEVRKWVSEGQFEETDFLIV